jgi:hypothetical protein
MRVGFNVGPNYFGDLLDVGMERCSVAIAAIRK